eukprot:jgi/Psemu1/309983/fgenesh1_kg.575_\
MPSKKKKPQTGKQRKKQREWRRKQDEEIKAKQAAFIESRGPILDYCRNHGDKLVTGGEENLRMAIASIFDYAHKSPPEEDWEKLNIITKICDAFKDNGSEFRDLSP